MEFQAAVLVEQRHPLEIWEVDRAPIGCEVKVKFLNHVSVGHRSTKCLVQKDLTNFFHI